ncbi:MAG: 16S rRNA (cytidine(1402)-2'-O)-methyltransferase [Betaproteobacteria bacterium]|nr:16S rRNA (cytidine(1402)-2'-O)-methyltransferase [Betaproteobacteria bacterium]
MVATPLGNLRDLGLRALDVLASADVIGAEDTRVTTVLLRHYGIATRPVSIREHNESRRAIEVIEWLRAGRSVAVVSDAGTPGVSDPGARVVAAVRAAGLPVVPIPGANAAIAAVSAAGLAAERFLVSRLPAAGGAARRALLESVAALPGALVCYEAPTGCAATVADLLGICGGTRELAVARELTKRFETIASPSPLAEAAAWFDADANRERGEFVLIVDQAESTSAPATARRQDARQLCGRWSRNRPPARVARVTAAAATGLPRAELYALAVALKGAPD